MTRSEAAMKAELLRLKMAHPELLHAFAQARNAVREAEDRMDRLKLDIAAQHKSVEQKEKKT